MNENMQIVKTFRQFIWHEDNINGADAELNRFLQQPGLVEIIRMVTEVKDEGAIRWVEAWFAPPPKPTSAPKKQPQQSQRRGIFQRGG